VSFFVSFIEHSLVRQMQLSQSLCAFCETRSFVCCNDGSERFVT